MTAAPTKENYPGDRTPTTCSAMLPIAAKPAFAACHRASYKVAEYRSERLAPSPNEALKQGQNAKAS